MLNKITVELELETDSDFDIDELKTNLEKTIEKDFLIGYDYISHSLFVDSEEIEE